MQVLRIKRKTANKVELAQLLITTYCLISGIDANRTEVLVLAYMAVYGVRQATKDLIVKSQILRSYNSLENAVSRLRKKGLLVRDDVGAARICDALSATVENRMGIIIDLRNT